MLTPYFKNPPTKSHVCRTVQSIAISAPDHLPGHLCHDPESLIPVVQSFPMRITPYYLSLIKRPDDALGRQVIPDSREMQDPGADADPLGEEAQSPAPLIVHRYPQRVIFLVSDRCAVYCRFCMRKRRVGTQNHVTGRRIAAGLDYIDRQHEINEVVLSGGDPLMLSDDGLVDILSTLKKIPHVKVLRIHTRVPCAWPQRVTPLLVRRLASFHPIYVNIHFNHPDEITPEAAQACALLAGSGIPLGAQTVLLNGVNDSPEILRRLMEALLCIRVKPYYLHQIDRVPGTARFRVPIERSLELMADLRGCLSGMAMPHFMIDLPGGGGKMELLPESIVKKGGDHWTVRNFQGRLFRYPVS